MYLNDAFDAQFDQQHRPERPIPSGAIRVESVWGWGFSWLAMGLACLFLFGKTTLIFALMLAIAILVYDALHKIFAFAPVLMAGCRLLLILLAGSAGRDGVIGLTVWTALGMAAYIVGLSYLARKESLRGSLRYWPCALLVAPLILALVVNRGEYQVRAFLLGLVLAGWLAHCLHFALRSAQPNIGRGVAGLLAGIPLVDWLSAWEGSLWVSAGFLALFATALLLQRFIPAT
jgi:4-hydroxybenzoate polyprenyltransferase